MVTGSFSGNANFGPGGPRTSQGSGDAFVARYSPTGTLLWFRDLGGTQTDAGLGVASDAAGNVYVTGSFQGQATFGTGASATLTALGQTDAFALKLDSSGAFQWVHDFGGTLASAAGNSITCVKGNVYLTGQFSGLVDFDPRQSNVTLQPDNGSAAFASKLDSSGNFLWAAAVNVDDGAVGRGIAVDGNGHVFVTGSCHNLTEGFVTELDGTGNSNAVAPLNSLWTSLFTGANATDSGTGIAVDGNGNVYVTGSFQGTTTFGVGFRTNPSSITLTAVGGGPNFSNAFVSKLDSYGDFLWVSPIGGTTATGKGTISAAGNSIAVDSSNRVYVTGIFQGTNRFGSTVLTSAGAPNGFVSALDCQGNFLWSRQMGGQNASATGTAVAVDGSGNVFAAGSFTGNVNFDPGLSNRSLPAPGTNFFLAQLTQTAIMGSVTDQNVGVPGVPVQLYASTDTRIGNSDDRLVETTVTDSKGNYQLIWWPTGCSIIWSSAPRLVCRLPNRAPPPAPTVRARPLCSR